MLTSSAALGFLSVCFQKKVSFEPSTFHLLKNLKPFSSYTFQLAARSRHGIGAYTNEVFIDTPQTRRSHDEYCGECVCACVCVCQRQSGFNFVDANMRRNKRTANVWIPPS